MGDIEETLTSKLTDCIGIQYSKCDITKPEQVRVGLANCESIFHCASVIDIRYSPSPRVFDVNVAGTKNILSFCNNKSEARNHAQLLIYTSSIEVYISADRTGDALKNMREDLPVYGRAFGQQYGATKAAAEEMVVENTKLNDTLQVAALRLGGV